MKLASDRGVASNTITIGITVSPAILKNGRSVIDRNFENAVRNISWQSNGPMFKATFGEKPDRFGLKRLGPIGGDFEQFRRAHAVDDIYYSSKDLKDVYIICWAEEIGDEADDASWTRRPRCEHHYYSFTLGAMIQMRYRRVRLKDWQALQADAETLLKTFQFRNLMGDVGTNSEQ